MIRQFPLSWRAKSHFPYHWVQCTNRRMRPNTVSGAAIISNFLNLSSIDWGGYRRFVITVLSSINCEIKRLILTVEKKEMWPCLTTVILMNRIWSTPKRLYTRQNWPVGLFTNNMNIREAINNIEIIKYVGHVVVMKHMFHNVWQVIITLEPASILRSQRQTRLSEIRPSHCGHQRQTVFSERRLILD